MSTAFESLQSKDEETPESKEFVFSYITPRGSFLPRIFQEEGLARSSSGGPSAPCATPYQPPHPGNQECRYWIIPVLPLSGVDGEGELAGGSVLGSRTFWRTKSITQSPMKTQWSASCSHNGGNMAVHRHSAGFIVELFKITTSAISSSFWNQS